MPTAAAFTLSNVCKSYGHYSAVTDISLSFSSSETCLLVGPNGSGKSTLLKLLAGLISPDGGTITISREILDHPIGYTAHEAGMYGALTVKENLVLFSRLLRETESVELLLERWQLGTISGRMLWELSRGQQARVALARAFLGSPRCVLLDEPTAFLDDASTDSLCNFLKHPGAERLVIIATHDVGRLSQLAPRIISLHCGAVV